MTPIGYCGRLFAALASCALLTIIPVSQASAQSGQPSITKGDWPAYWGSVNGDRYSPLDQINGGNFSKLEVAWHFKTDALGTHPEFKLEGTPLEINGTIYTTAGSRRDVVALDAKTGELKWVYGLNEGLRAALAPRQLSGRGVSYWTDGNGDERILFITIGYRLVELNAHTGQPIQSFGDHGMIDMKVGAYTGVPGQPGVYKQIDLTTGEIGVHETPTVVDDVVMVGSSMKEGFQVTTQNNTKGITRAWDVKTGKLLWTFHDIPQKGEFGYDSWENNSADYNGNAGSWTGITADPELGNVYIPVEDATNDVYGGSRPGNDLFADSLVCVDLHTGKMKWYYQLVHHPVWNYDISSPPMMADIMVDGKPIKAVAVPGKQAMLYVFDRVTGKPVWPIIETPVPASDVPGEKMSKTQPIPSKPKPYGRNAFRMDDLIDFTPQLHAEALEILKHVKVGGLFAPIVVSKAEGPVGTLENWNGTGGTNWTGGAYDVDNDSVLVPSNETGAAIRGLVTPPPGYTDARYEEGQFGQPFTIQLGGGMGQAPDAPKLTSEQAKVAASVAAAGAVKPTQPAVRATVEGLPIVTPPYGTITSINLDTGDFRWQRPHGDTPDSVKNNPALKGLTIPQTGQAGNVSILVTKTLVISGDPEYSTAPGRPRGAMLHGYDKLTGKELGTVYMPAPQSGGPMTYSLDGKQYVIVAVSGGNYSGDYIAYTLPNN